ncbi:TIGR04438 family Trp-rich protein [Comamonas sediminis]|uniref:TIGR04438 family Trp-rich protein n=1 Tax=Comamonas sediminis TaxID=1783360 RepID=UPI003D2CF6A3
MYLLIIAVVVLMLKIYDIPPVNSWLWMEVLLPSFMALLWKLWADWSGYTRRRLRARHARRRSARYVQDKGLFKINATPRPPSRQELPTRPGQPAHPGTGLPRRQDGRPQCPVPCVCGLRARRPHP